ncbi:MAG TPA: NADH-quinone oxidoreductase subunit N, partial [Anaeromyxobacteraceae bacterium]|nr:NADH-quinone oxidoreductase subunit N [Anaeromyxobacteraceae bacterium]
NAKSAEGAMKYFMVGAFATSVLLYGMALIYGAVGSTSLSEIARQASHVASAPLFIMGVLLILVALGFKISAVPFHMWAPDAYEGAPTPVTAFMATTVKAAAFATLIRLESTAFVRPDLAYGSSGWATICAWLAVLTMTLGNLAALRQDNVKRMLAYSSIAHAGYLLVGVLAASVAGAREKALSGILFYLASYTASAIGAFAVVGAIEKKARLDDEPGEAWDLARFSGLARRHPGLAFVMTVFLLSMAGVPPTAGFIGKLYVFQAAVGAELYGLAIFGILTSAMGAYYYLRVVVFMYMRPAEGAEEAISSPALSFALAAAAIAVVVLGIGADPLLRIAQAAGSIIM